MKRFMLVVLGVILTACGGGYEGPEQGRITEKHYDDPDEWYQPGYTIDGGQNCSGGYNDQPRTCWDNPDTHIPGMWHQDPASWSLTIEAEDKKGNFGVDETTYHNVKVGQWFDTKTGEVIPK